MEFLNILAATIPVFLIVGVGFFTHRIGMVSEESERSIMKLVVNILYPCFILSKVPGNKSLQDVTLVGIALSAGLLLMVMALIVAFAMGRLLKIRAEDGLNTFCLSTAVQNYGFIPIPMIIALFPESADETLGVLFVHNLGLEIAMWTIGIVVLSGSMAGAAKRLINGPTIAIALGLTLNFSGLYLWIPSVLNKAIADLGICTVPISLVLVGASLASVIQRESWQTRWKVVMGSVAVRFAIMPVFFLLVARLVSFSPELRNVLLVEAAMPAAIFPIVLSKYFGGKPGVAVQVSLATSVLSLVMTPLLLTMALRLFSVGTAPKGTVMVLEFLFG